MPTVRTHYDDLGVPRDASAEDIARAFDLKIDDLERRRAKGDLEAGMLVGMIRGAFAVLSNAARRAEHDEWIRRNETEGEPSRPRRSAGRPPAAPRPTAHRSPRRMAAPGRWLHKEWSRWRRPLVQVVVILGILWAGIHWWPVISTQLTKFRSDNQVGVVRPTGFDGRKIGYRPAEKAPNGQPWPAKSGYVAGYPRERTGGLAGIEADNSQGTTDVFARLVWLDGTKERVIRVIFVQAKQRFSMEGLPAGRYVLKYLELDSGAIAKTDPLEVSLKKKPDGGEEWQGWVVGLYGVIDGKDYRESISEQEFAAGEG